MTRDVIAVKKNLALGRRQKLGDQVKARAFTRTIWADDGVNGVALDLQVDIIDSYKSKKFLGQVARLDNVFSSSWVTVLRTEWGLSLISGKPLRPEG